VTRSLPSSLTYNSTRDRRFTTWLFTIVMMAALVFAGAAKAKSPPDSFADLAAKLLPAVVNVSTTSVRKSSERTTPRAPNVPPGSPFEEFFKDFMERNRPPTGPRRATSLGSGFIIDKSGIVITNNHVIADADEIKVILQDGTRLDAKVLGRDSKTDLAVLKVNSKKDLPTVEFGDSDHARVGDWVVAIGNPFGLGGSVTAGIVSARHRDINSGPYDDFIQTDAAINRGNSGGPLFNIEGQVVGINTAIISPRGGSVGIGFAIPANLAKPVIAQLKEFGRTKRGWLGVRIQSVDREIAESVGLGKPRGALVVNVTQGGPAEKAGIQARDIILKFGGQDVTAMRKLPRIVADNKVGSTVEVVLWRAGKEKTVNVTLGELEAAEKALQVSAKRNQPVPRPGGDIAETLGLTLSNITPALRRQFRVGRNVQGVLITKVDGTSTAFSKGIRAGDVVVEAGQDKVGSPQDVLDKIKKARSSGRKSLLLLVNRKGDQRFVALRLHEG
jgi:serine protease Do